MPLYEYGCHACGRRFEQLQALGAGSDGVRCPECGAETVERQLSTFAAMAGSVAKSAEPAGCGAPSCCMGACGDAAFN